jgi:hypothetical protein
MVLIIPRFSASDEPDMNDYLISVLLIGVFFFRSNFLTFNYLFNDFNQIVEIIKKNLIVCKGGKKKKIELSKVRRCYFVEPSFVSGNMNTVSSFNYCCFLLTDGNRIFVTSLSVPIEKTLKENRIDFVTIKMFLPYIDGKIGELLVEN